MGIRFAAVLVFAFLGQNVQAADLIDEFSPDLNQSRWCACQLNPEQVDKIIHRDPNDANDSVAIIPVKGSSLGDRKCDTSTCGVPTDMYLSGLPPVAEAPLGPSMIAIDEVEWSANENLPNPYCRGDVITRAGSLKNCIQREELRLDTSFTGDPMHTRYYSLKFRMPKTVLNQTHSVRWIIAQWKMEPVKTHGGEEPSPILAQRYDNGVLHITVQSEGCRCLVASAALPNGKHYPWSDKARYCLRTDLAAHDGDRCYPNLTLEYPKDTKEARLDSPAGEWVEMRYNIRAGENGQIEVYQDNRFIVRITGKIGYDLDPTADDPVARMKFKMGHYRDYIPSDDDFEIDWFKVSERPLQ